MSNKICKCGEEYYQYTTLQNKCPKCLADAARKKRLSHENKKKKEERKIYKEMKEKVKSRGQLAKEAQTEFNKYIRERDSREPCISCGRHHQGQYHAGHYRTVGSAPELRFEELNCHKQCSACNNHLSGNLIEYRKNLILKIGLDKVEWLEGHHDQKKYSHDDLRNIKAEFREKARELKKARI